MPRPREIEPESLTPFARLIYQYLRDHWMNVNQFAEHTGISSTAVWKWIREGRVPEAATVATVARATGIPADELRDAAIRTAASRATATETWEYILSILESRLEHITDLGAQQRAEVVRTVRELRDDYVAGGGGPKPRQEHDGDGILVLRPEREDAPNPAAPSRA